MCTIYKGLKKKLITIVIANNYQKLGLGKILLNKIINSKPIKDVEKVYLMTTNCKEFYQGCGFTETCTQTLLVNTNR